MDLYAILEGPLLWIIFLVFFAGILTRSVFFLRALKKTNSRSEEKKQISIPTILARFFLPLHKAFVKKPFYTAIRYIFHVCLFVVPIWLSGHIILWSESRFEWDWAALPEAWADWMTLVFLALAAYFLLRRILSRRVWRDSSITDFVLIFIAALPFLTGYFLTHDTLGSVTFLGDNMIVIHMLCGQLMILMVLFLFYKTRFKVELCTGCASCVQNCPTETLESHDHENLRIFKYAHFQCICCGSCVSVCPEGAAELRHEINAKRLFVVSSKRQIRSVELEACEKCGAYFAPEPQMEKIGLIFDSDCIKCCPNCRKTKMGERLHQMSPWHRSPKESGETLRTARR
jgi:ferredoxin